MSDEFDATAREVIDSIEGSAWRRFCEMGDSAPVIAAIASALRSAVKREREECAIIARAYFNDGGWDRDACEAIEATIRFRGEN